MAVILPLVTFIWWTLVAWNDIENRVNAIELTDIEALDERIESLENNQAVTVEAIGTIKDDIKDIKADIKTLLNIFLPKP